MYSNSIIFDNSRQWSIIHRMRIAPIIGYEGRYSIREDGVVISHLNAPSHGYLGDHPLKVARNKCGYDYVSLLKSKRLKKLKIHRLLAIAFIGNPKNLPCVNHKDGDKSHNEISNLEWCTYKDNTKHAMEFGTWRNAHIKTERQLKNLTKRKSLV